MSYCEGKKFPNWPMAPWPDTFEYRRNTWPGVDDYFCTCSREELLERYARNSKLTIYDSELLIEERKMRCGGCRKILKNRMSRCRHCDAIYERWTHPNLCHRYQLCKACFSDLPVEERCVCYGQELKTDKVEVPDDYLRIFPPKPLTLSEIDDFLEGF